MLNAAELTANDVEVNGNVERKCERRVFDDGIAIRYSLPDGRLWGLSPARPGDLSDYAAANGFGDCFRPVGDAELSEGVLHVVLQRVDAHSGYAGDLDVLEPF